MGKRKINSSISIIRVLAMMSIIFGHICDWKGINLYQLGGIGVEIFLFVSGYLYGNKRIPDPKRWFTTRIERVLTPFWLLSLFLSAYLAINGMFERALTQLGSTLLNLQGINRIFFHIPQIGATNLDSLDHCWFLTVIMVCYALIIWVKNSNLEAAIDRHPGKALLLAGAAQVVCAYFGIQLSYLIQFFVGYFYCRVEDRVSPVKGKLLAGATMSMVAACIIRLIANAMIDGTIFYERVIARVSFVLIASWIFWVMDALCHRFDRLSQKIANSRIWLKLDSLSYPIFLVHYMFLQEPFSVDQYTNVVYIQIFSFLLLSFIAANLLEKANRGLSGYLRGQQRQ